MSRLTDYTISPQIITYSCHYLCDSSLLVDAKRQLALDCITLYLSTNHALQNDFLSIH